MLGSALAPTTLDTYGKVWQTVQLFIMNVLKEPVLLPFSLHQVAKYVTHMWLQGYAHSTVASSMSAVAFAHKIRGFRDPTDAFLIRKLLAAIKKLKGPSKVRRPITQSLLGLLVELLEMLGLGTWDTVLVRALMLLLYNGGLRVGELVVSGKKSQHTPLLTALFMELDGTNIAAYILRLDSFKHSVGEPAWIKYTPNRDATLCPVRALYSYLLLRGNVPGFIFLMEDGTPVKSAWFTTTLRSILQLAGLDPTKYAPHSFRIGATTDLVGRGASVETIKAFGRWKTGAYSKYIRHNMVVV